MYIVAYITNASLKYPELQTYINFYFIIYSFVIGSLVAGLLLRGAPRPWLGVHGPKLSFA